MLGGCEDGVDPVQDELPPTVVASPIYRGLVLFPNIEREGMPQWPIQAILTKGGLRLPKALVVTPSWAPR